VAALFPVMPAKAGIQVPGGEDVDPRFRGGDDSLSVMPAQTALLVMPDSIGHPRPRRVDPRLRGGDEGERG
jgi:hypothetical protein